MLRTSLLITCGFVVSFCAIRSARALNLVGTLQPETQHAQSIKDHKIDAVVIELYWSRYEPAEGKYNQEFIDQTRAAMKIYRELGIKMVLEMGIQDTPQWVFTKPQSHFVNQFGDEFVPGPGACGVNAVFSQSMRDLVGGYIDRVFSDLGTEFIAVRVGGGFYGEIGYPHWKFNGRNNCYWSFDPIAQGKAKGLAGGQVPCPVPGWKPGTGTPQQAKRFFDWHVASLANYQNWLIATVRKRCPTTTIAVLYPSWGTRPGQPEAAIAKLLDGTTSPEINGEVPRGLVFDKLASAIYDDHAALWCTWLEADASGDSSPDASRWSPAKFIAYCAHSHPRKLAAWCENGSPGGVDKLRLCLDQIQKNSYDVFFYAFEKDLFNGNGATIDDLQNFTSKIRSVKP